MANINQVPVPNGQAAQIWGARGAPGVSSVLFYNQDLSNTVWVGQESTITPGSVNTIPVPPNGNVTGDAGTPWYVVGSAAGIMPLVVVPNGVGVFLGITQGLGNLAIPSVRSPNFVTGVSGWQISKNGNAEFNNVTVRGQFGAYGNGGSYIVIVNQAGFPVIFLNPPNTVHVSNIPDFFTTAQNAGLVNERIEMVLSSGKESGNADAALQLFSASADNTLAAFATMEFGGQVGTFFTASGLIACHPGSAATQESWQSLGTIAGSNCTISQARYQISPDGMHCEIDIVLVAGVGGSVAGTYTFSSTLPSGYQFPGAFLRICPFPFNAQIVTATQDSIIAVDGTGGGVPGRVRVTIPAVAANVVFGGQSVMIPIT